MNTKILIVFFVVASFLVAGCGNQEGIDNIKEDKAGLPNPASVNCEEKGGISQITTAPDGSQSGICLLSNGFVCDEWEFYRGECPLENATPAFPNDAPSPQLANPAAVNCINRRGFLTYEPDKNGAQRGICTLPNGTTCEEWELFRGQCGLEFEIVNNTGTACRNNSDCETPSEYMLRSDCPYSSRCIEKKCAVVCPNLGSLYIKDCSKGCPQFSPPAPGWCSEGAIVELENDECGCKLPPVCDIRPCAEDLKICPGGKSVRRIPPECKFELCEVEISANRTVNPLEITESNI